MTNELGPGERPSTYVVGEPDSSGTTVTISEAARRTGTSISTLRRRLAKGQVPGAHKAPGPDGEEWRIPVAALDSIEPTPKEKRARPEDDLVDELTTLRATLAETERRAVVAEALLDSERRAREDLSKTVEVLRESIEALNRALPPAPSPLVTALVDSVTTPTVVGGGQGATPIEQALAKGPRSWFRRKAPKPTA